MHEHDPEGTPWCAQARAQWVHELRNAVNTAGVSMTLARRLLTGGDPASAEEMFGMSEKAWGRCRDLLASAADATSVEDPSMHARHASGAAPEPPSPHWRR